MCRGALLAAPVACGELLRNHRALLMMEREFLDYKKMRIHLNQFMGSNSSIGAERVTNVCIAFRATTEQNNRAGCLRALEMLQHEYCYLKNKLHELFQATIPGFLSKGLSIEEGELLLQRSVKLAVVLVEKDIERSQLLGHGELGRPCPGGTVPGM
ncbi:HPT domain superfamily [Sesbania bispinosa]|nr:HPT domain superfamily [Sesbania bispinosa]